MENYYKHLNRVQKKYTVIDMITITGLMDAEQKIAHLLRYAELVQDAEAVAYCINN